jgi:hypothetical protein
MKIIIEYDSNIKFWYGSAKAEKSKRSSIKTMISKILYWLRLTGGEKLFSILVHQEAVEKDGDTNILKIRYLACKEVLFDII